MGFFFEKGSEKGRPRNLFCWAFYWLPNNLKIFRSDSRKYKNWQSRKKAIANPLFETLINFGKIKKKTKNFVAIFSDNDPYVLLEFSGSDNVIALSIVLDELLKMAK